MTSDEETVSLPASVYAAVDERVDGTEFPTVDAYVSYCLEEVVHATESAGADAVDEQEVRDRLESLGYVE